MSREFSVLAAKSIPLPGKGVKVLSRHVRVAVFNKNDVRLVLHSNTWLMYLVVFLTESPPQNGKIVFSKIFILCTV